MHLILVMSFRQPRARFLIDQKPTKKNEVLFILQNHMVRKDIPEQLYTCQIIT